MIKFFTALFSLLVQLLDLWKRYNQQRKRQQHQENADEIRKDPVDFANRKFGARVSKPAEDMHSGDTDRN
ncbi:hypothetical protein [Gilvimarinus sp. 1_MG-2023]|uniref:hypothetical protein n=1 Tax=Gilvimarinus sp. 1_MG-2023 TaxID=3062638 RepID=UPI0026E3AC66|nr:hypothetical protein [Gilvimarinus sp. 1_MG-2023]MDO6747187.1 hypothetical protein [Gilvimarinus sp. 1_MG-2023]